MACCNFFSFLFLFSHLVPTWGGENFVGTDCSKNCEALRKVIIPISTVSLECRGSKCKWILDAEKKNVIYHVEVK